MERNYSFTRSWPLHQAEVLALRPDRFIPQDRALGIHCTEALVDPEPVRNLGYTRKPRNEKRPLGLPERSLPTLLNTPSQLLPAC